MSQKHHRFGTRSKVPTHLQGKSHVLCHVTYTHMRLWTTLSQLPLSELGSNQAGAWILPLEGQPVLYGNTLQSLISHQKTPLLTGGAPLPPTFAQPRAKHGSWSQVGFRGTIYVLLVEDLGGNAGVAPSLHRAKPRQRSFRWLTKTHTVSEQQI